MAGLFTGMLSTIIQSRAEHVGAGILAHPAAVDTTSVAGCSLIWRMILAEADFNEGVLAAEALLLPNRSTRAAISGMTLLLTLVQTTVQSGATDLPAGALLMTRAVGTSQVFAYLTAPTFLLDQHSAGLAGSRMTKRMTRMPAWSLSSAWLTAGVRRLTRSQSGVLQSVAKTFVSDRGLVGRESRVARGATPLNDQLRLQLSSLTQISERSARPILDAMEMVDSMAGRTTVDAFFGRNVAYTDRALPLTQNQRMRQSL